MTEGTGTAEAIRAEVRRQIKELAPGGGYGLSSGAGLTRYVELENFLAMREALLEYGTYPIRLYSQKIQISLYLVDRDSLLLAARENPAAKSADFHPP